MSENKRFYRIENRKTGAVRLIEHSSAQEACLECGWLIADCFVKVDPKKGNLAAEGDKWWVCSLTQSILAPTEEKALEDFEHNMNVGHYESGSIDIEEDDQSLYT